MERVFKGFRSFVVVYYCQPPAAGAFSRDFNTNLAPQCSAFSTALIIEELKSPLFPCHEGAGDSLQMTGALHLSTIQREQGRIF